MTARSPYLMSIIFLGLSLAGCVASEDAGTASDNGWSSEVASFTDETGGIQGLVQTDELLPIAGAVVGILENEATAVTSDAGVFALSNIQPGTYTVAAQALGYESSAQRVTVAAGSVEQLDFVLTALPSDAPYHFTDTRIIEMSAIGWKLTPECIYTDVNTLAKTCGGVRLGCAPSGNCEVHYEDEGSEDWHTLLGEVTWEAQSGVTGRGYSFDINAPNITRGQGGSINQADPYTFDQETDEPPIITRIDNPTTLLERNIAEKDWYGDWFYRMFAGKCDLGFCESGFGPDYGIMYEARATVYMTWFFKEPAEAGWTALPDA